MSRTRIRWKADEHSERSYHGRGWLRVVGEFSGDLPTILYLCTAICSPSPTHERVCFLRPANLESSRLPTPTKKIHGSVIVSGVKVRGSVKLQGRPGRRVVQQYFSEVQYKVRSNDGSMVLLLRVDELIDRSMDLCPPKTTESQREHKQWPISSQQASQHGMPTADSSLPTQLLL